MKSSLLNNKSIGNIFMNNKYTKLNLSKINIRKAHASDLDNIKKLISRATRGMTSFNNIEERISKDIVFIMEEDNIIIGITMILLPKKDKLVYFKKEGTNLIPIIAYDVPVLKFGGTYISPEYRSRGLSKKLSSHRISYLKQREFKGTVIAEMRGICKVGRVHPETENAVKSLKSLGFRETNFYATDDLGPILEGRFYD